MTVRWASSLNIATLHRYSYGGASANEGVDDTLDVDVDDHWCVYIYI